LLIAFTEIAVVRQVPLRFSPNGYSSPIFPLLEEDRPSAIMPAFTRLIEREFGGFVAPPGYA
jgi:hypothetical protein